MDCWHEICAVRMLLLVSYRDATALADTSSLGRPLKARKARKAREMLLTAVLGPLLPGHLGTWAPLPTPEAPEWRPAEAFRSLR